MEIIRQGRDIILNPQVHLCTIVWLHGLGDSAEGFLPLFQGNTLLSNCRIVLLTALVNPVTVNGGMRMNSWYDFKTIEDEFDCSADISAERLIKVLEEERKKTEVLVLGGLSQGAVMSLYTGLAKYTGKLDAIVALSGYAFPMQIPESRKNIPVLLYNGAVDPLLTLRRCQRSFDAHLQGANVTQHVDPNLPHTISDEEWNFVSTWLKAKLNLN